MARLGDLFIHIRNGVNIKQGLDNTGYPITRIETISNRVVNRTKMGYAGITDVSKYSDYILQDGDILMSHINSEIHLGKTALYEKVDDEIIIHGMNLLSLRPNKDLIDSKYAFYYLSSQAFLRQIPNITKKSVNQASFTVSALKELEFPVTTIEEQKKIANDLDKLNNLIELRTQQLSKLDELVKSRFIELFDDAKEEDKLINLCNFIDYRGKTPEKAERGLPFITAKNVKMHHMSFDTQEFISKETYDKVMTRGFPKIGDVVFTTEAPLGNVCRIPYIETEFYIGQRIITMQTEQLEPAYLEYALSSDDFKRKIAEKSSGSTVTGIRSKLLEQLTIPVPHRALQKQFATFVEQTDKSKLAIQQSLNKLELLKKSLMQEYFG
jgi:type I restriction enzyme S subunit